MERMVIEEKVVELRKEGRTYSEIKKILRTDVSKSTLSYWCKDIRLSKESQDRIQEIIRKNREKARATALITNKIKRDRYLKSIIIRNKYLRKVIRNKDTAKIALAMLYLSEGSKDLKRGSIMFGNSDPLIISLFLRLLRKCYRIDENKFRCTLQCRADQNIKRLEKFWSKATNVPLSQFYKARIDYRTLGKPSKKSDYKGVCRIDYFSAEIFIELMQVAKIIYKGP
jgi:hypothetical protein